MSIELNMPGSVEGMGAQGARGGHRARAVDGGAADTSSGGFMAFLSQFDALPATGLASMPEGGEPGDSRASREAGTGGLAAAGADALPTGAADASALLIQMQMSLNNSSGAALPDAATAGGALSDRGPGALTACLPASSALTALMPQASGDDTANMASPKGGNAEGGLLPAANPESLLQRAMAASGGVAAGPLMSGAQQENVQWAQALKSGMEGLAASTHRAMIKTAGSDAVATPDPDNKPLAKGLVTDLAAAGGQVPSTLLDNGMPPAEKPATHGRLPVDLNALAGFLPENQSKGQGSPVVAWAEGLRQLGEVSKAERANGAPHAESTTPSQRSDALAAASWSFSPLASSSPSESAAAASQPSGLAPEQQSAQQVSVWVSQNVQSAELKLDALGKDPVEVSISLSGNEAQVQFRTDTPETRDLLTRAVAHLDTALQREGLVLSGVTVGTSAQNGDNAREAGENAGAAARSAQRAGGAEVVEGVRMTAVPRTLQGAVDLFV